MKNWKIYLDNTLQKTIELKADFNSVLPGEHEVKIEAYNNSTLLDTKIRKVNVAGIELDPDPDYQAVLDYATANGIPHPDSPQKQIDNQLIIDLKAAGIWQTTVAFHNFKGTATSAFKLIDWKRLVQVTAFGDPTWSVDGVQGNAFNAYVNLGWNRSDIGMNFNDVTVSYKLYNADITSNEPYSVVIGQATSGTSTSQSRFYLYQGTFGATLFGRNETAVANTLDANGVHQYSIDPNGVRTLFINQVAKGTTTFKAVSDELYHFYLLAQNRTNTAAAFTKVGMSNFIVVNNDMTANPETLNSILS